MVKEFTLEEDMEFTPESNVYFNSCKGGPCHDDGADSGYSGLFHSPQSTSGGGSLSAVEQDETSKENLRLSPTRREMIRDTTQWSSTVSWCETPKVSKRDAFLRHRLAVGKSIINANTCRSTSPCTKQPDSSHRLMSGQSLSSSLDSVDTVKETMAPSTLTLDLDLPLSGRKRRFLFSQLKTSTHIDGNLNSAHLSIFEGELSVSDADLKDSCSVSDQTSDETPCLSKFSPESLKESSQSPVSEVADNLCDSSTVFCTPSSIHTPKYVRSVCEDSGFSSLTLDKSQDSSVDHDGSFQELLVSASRGNGEIQSLGESRRRSRLQRQHRLSTLQEGGSQSDDDPTVRKNSLDQCQDRCKDVFTVTATPCTPVLSLTMVSNMSSDGLISAKQDFTTPRGVTTVKPESGTPFNSATATPGVTPLKQTPVNLSLTPALQLVHAMCQQKTQKFSGHSPSLKEELKFTAALAETQMMFRTTMPLAGLIGRKMGLGQVDILTELKKRSLRHILSIILSLLKPECIYRFGLVCRSWNEIILQDKRASFRRCHYLNATLELGRVDYVPEADTRLTLLTRSALKTVQSQARRSGSYTPQSGGSALTPLQRSTSRSNSKRDKFLEVAKTLFNDESLKPCPRCQHPSRCHSVKREGVCSSTDCGFQFCTACLCAFHGSRDCGSLSVDRCKKDILIPGSAQSKRNVRRL